MKTVIAIQSFDHGGVRRRGDVFEVSPQVAEQLRRNGLVRIHGESKSSVDPSPAAGGNSSASPAAPASRKRTAKKSESGETDAQQTEQ